VYSLTRRVDVHFGVGELPPTKFSPPTSPSRTKRRSTVSNTRRILRKLADDNALGPTERTGKPVRRKALNLRLWNFTHFLRYVVAALNGRAIGNA
jgi:hypothetical protein